MDIKQLRCFAMVAEELHFGRAASRLNMAQPPLSRHIKLLEEELGSQLFERTNRKVILSEFGQSFLKEVRPLVTGFNRLPELAGQLQAGSNGRLNIGAVAPALDHTLPALLRRFTKQNPGTDLKLHIDDTPNQLELVRKGDLHFGFVHLFSHKIEDLQSTLISREEALLAVPAGHRFAGEIRIPLGDLDGANLIFFPRHSHPQLYDATLGALHQAGANINITQEAYYQSMLLAMVAANLGVCFVPESAAKTPRPDIAFIEIEGQLPVTEVHAVWRRGENSPLAETFATFLQNGKQVNG